MKEHIPDVKEFDYSSIDSVARFLGTHPNVMNESVLNQDWKLNIDPSKKKLSSRYKVLLLWEKLTGIRLGEYRNYKLIK
jgi:hypothetical protein